MTRSGPRDTATAMLEAVRMLHASHDALLERAAERYGISRNDLRCLEVLQREGPMRPQQLAVRSQLSPAAITKVTDRLVAAGFVERRPVEGDRRGHLLGLSGHRADLRQETWDGVRDDALAELATLEPADARRFARTLTALAAINSAHAERLADS
ncbi:MarR family winged helix-turn-helix transcriptional regulator [Georgenia deserti]|uniref:MarR family winged helix-turn-helix transcriptional regulator n=1 Tax=Georgenia deserti TaxID=2093781 RepID=A0ABW4L4E1_9MICO